MSLDRRQFVKLGLALQAAAALGVDGAAAQLASPDLKFGPAESFSREALKAKVRELAKAAYV